MFTYQGRSSTRPNHIVLTYCDGDYTHTFEVYHDYIDRDDSYLGEQRLELPTWGISWSGDTIRIWSDSDEKQYDPHQKPDVCQTFSVKAIPARVTSLVNALKDWSRDYYGE